jgi:hypothetical protein
VSDDHVKPGFATENGWNARRERAEILIHFAGEIGPAHGGRAGRHGRHVNEVEVGADLAGETAGEVEGDTSWAREVDGGQNARGRQHGRVVSLTPGTEHRPCHHAAGRSRGDGRVILFSVTVRTCGILWGHHGRFRSVDAATA